MSTTRTRKRQPKAGSPAQREMAGDLADRVMANEREIFNTDLAMNENGHGPDDLAYHQGCKITNLEGEQDHLPRAQGHGAQHEPEAAYPTLMPAARKLIRKARQEIDEQPQMHDEQWIACELEYADE